MGPNREGGRTGGQEHHAQPNQSSNQNQVEIKQIPEKTLELY
jgi:hypothetical protein